MNDIRFSDDEKAAITRKVQLYFSEELKQQIGRFDAEFLIDFFAKEVGAYFYNAGVRDAQAVLSAKVEDLQDVLYQLEKPTEFNR